MAIFLSIMEYMYLGNILYISIYKNSIWSAK
jgi:hypothetical protein